MVLQTEPVDIPLATGVDTKGDPKQTPALLRMENAYVDRDGEIRRRPGVSLLTTKAYNDGYDQDDSGEVVRSAAIVPGANGKALLFGEDVAPYPSAGTIAKEKLYKGLEGRGVFSWAGAFWRKMAVHELVRSTRSQFAALNSHAASRNSQDLHAEVAESDRYRVYAWYGKNSLDHAKKALYIAIDDLASGERIYQVETDNDVTTAGKFRVLYVQDADDGRMYFVVMKSDATALTKWAWAEGTDPDSSTNVSYLTLQTNDTWDAAETNYVGGASRRGMVVCEDSAAAGQLTFIPLTASDGAGVPAGDKTAVAVTGFNGHMALEDVKDVGGNNRIVVGYSNGANLYLYSYNTDTQTGAEQLVEALGLVDSGMGLSIVRAEKFDTTIGGNVSALMIAYTGPDSVTNTRDSVRLLLTNFDGSSVIVNEELYNAGMVGGLFVKDRHVYMVVEFGANATGGDGAQQDAYVVRVDGKEQNSADIRTHFVAKIGEGRAIHKHGGEFAEPSNVYHGRDGKMLYVSPLQGSLMTEESSTAKLRVSYHVFELDFDPAPPDYVPMGRSMIIGGGAVWNHDGVRLSENGFHVYPEEVTLTEAGSGGFVQNQVFSYRVVYEFMDSAGQLHQSAPSEAKTITIAGASSRSVDVECLFNWITNQAEKLVPVRAVIYRTEDGGSTYYRVSSLDVFDTGATQGTVTYNDTLADASLIKNTQLYTNGGVYENIGVPQAYSLAGRGGRVFAVAPGNSLWHSKKKGLNEGVSFSDFLTVVVEDGDENEAVAAMDAFVVLLKRGGLYLFGGDGPNDLGAGSFTLPEPVGTDVGCTNYASVAVSDSGVFFQFLGTIHRISRARVVEDIGAPVSGYLANGQQVRDTAVVPDLDQIRFLLDDQHTVLVFDTRRELWSVWTYGEALTGLAVIRDDVWMSVASGSAVIEGGEGGAPMVFETSWKHAKSLNGFQRIRWMHLIGQMDSTVRLKVEMMVDEDDTVVHEEIIDGSNQWGIKPAVQKCRSFKVRVSEMEGSEGELRLSAISLDTGVKKGTKRRGAER